VSDKTRRVWLFDLDNTLHNADPYIFPHISRAMTAYLCAHLDVDEAEARRLRRDYWQRYGATLLGLMRHHDIDPRDFLHQTHQIPDLARQVIAEHGLRALLRRLPGRRVIFSNAPLDYAEAVLTIIGIRPCFDAVYSIERLGFQAKPAIGGFLRLLRSEALDPRACVMVEDSLPNLKTAKRLGMKTVWVSTSTRRPPYVDVRLASVLGLPGRLGKL
jgi:putative hydrolase of the HAD superfamily